VVTLRQTYRGVADKLFELYQATEKFIAKRDRIDQALFIKTNDNLTDALTQQHVIVDRLTNREKLTSFYPKRVPLREILDAVIQDQRSRSDKITYEDKYGRMKADVHVDAFLLRQALSNIYRNAADAIQMTRRSDGRIVTRVNLTPQAAVIEISDNGVGICPEAAARLRNREPFFSTKAEAGTGIGFIMAHRIIEGSDYHAGKFSFSSALGAGTTVRVVLPLTEYSRQLILNRRGNHT
jgi:two-component system nitrogen regulation sensor histidine kinase NtrY